MNSFLFRVAQAYFRHYGSQIANFIFVFPNRRAGVFFQKYLTELAEQSLFAPEILTITDLFANLSQLQPADRLGNLFRLFRIYLKHSQKDENFDSFVFWGDMLLADFDEIDKHLIDARQLFTNISDLKELDYGFDTLTAEQKAAIRQFWSNFVPIAEGLAKEEFITLWKVLLPIYNDFRAELLAENIATEGMMWRAVAEKFKQNKISETEKKQFVFVGFNALTACESVLFKELKKQDKADFYFDFETAELQDTDNLASRFSNENRRLFPSKFKLETDVIPLNDKYIEKIAVPSAVGQAKQVERILEQLVREGNFSQKQLNTAVVLPDENLLLPMLYSFPSKIEQINITMGFPLKATPAFALFEHLFGLHRRAHKGKEGKRLFYHKDVLNILMHRYISENCRELCTELKQKITAENKIYIESSLGAENDLLALIFSEQSDVNLFVDYLLQIIEKIQNAENQLDKEFIQYYYDAFKRISEILKNEHTALSLETLLGLLRSLTQGLTVPFEGEPLAGLQVMGVLETRLLDFENVIITNFNEGIFPQRNIAQSFVPQRLRHAFGLPVSDLHDAITSYHFYRLIARAKRVFLLYDSRTEGTQTGEESRFGKQLYYQYGAPIVEKTLSYDIAAAENIKMSVQKSPEILQKLQNFLQPNGEKSFSASSLNNYLDCPYRFYLSQIEGIAQENELLELLDGSAFGKVFHKAMELIYRHFEGKMVEPQHFEAQLATTQTIQQAIRQAFAVEIFYRKDSESIELEGNNLLISKLLEKYIRKVLDIDKNYAPFRYISSEQKFTFACPVFGGAQTVNLKGFIDRIDEKDGIVRILDYKTGAGENLFETVEQIFDKTHKKRPKYALQTFLYGILYQNKTREKTIEPGIVFLREVFKDSFSTRLLQKTGKEKIPVTDFSPYEVEFRHELTELLEEIFDPSIPFVQASVSEHCTYCAFREICRK